MLTRATPIALVLSFVSSTAFAQADFAMVWSSEPSPVLTAGDTVSLSFDVENVGFSAAAYTVGFVIDNGVDAWLLHEESMASLSAGGFTSGSMTFVMPSGVDGVWYAGLVADPFDTIVESDEMNNVWQFASQLTIGGSTPMDMITVTSETLPNANVGSTYSATLRQSGATSPLWRVATGSLPPGLTLSATGVVSGVPSSAGSYNFVASAEQTGLVSGSGSFTINVTQGMSALTVTPSVLPQANAGVPYQAVLSTSGGTPPYGYQLIGAPAWLTLVGAGADAGTLRGTPEAAGRVDFTVYVIDSAGADATVMMSLDVFEATALSVVSSLPAGVTSKPYSTGLVMGGVPPYNVQVTSGALPGGLVLDSATGVITGVPSAPGQFSFQINATDSDNGSVAGSFVIPVTELVGLQISTAEITLYANAEADVALTVFGGVPPYTWQMLGGDLPPGVTFDAAAGKLVGRTGQVSMHVATFSATDAEGASAQADIAIAVRAFRPTGGAGGGRRSGCVCVTPSASDASGLFVLAGLFGLIVLRKRLVSRSS